MLALVLFVFSCACAHGLQVNTTEGVVEGSKALDGDYYTFYGIPYAGPTSGANRFKGPVPPSRHNGVFLANRKDVFCAQPTGRGLVGIEDCLTLNIFTKNITVTNSTRPVLVWLNTDEYTTTNTQMYSYKKLVEENVVFVTMNFRVSIFGFLCLGVQEAPGNAGLKDVVQGLKWIKFNIANFGGDPKNVVLIGHAAGAAMVDLLTLSPQTENLVHKAIAFSGSSISPWAVAYKPVEYAKALGDKLGYSGKSHGDLAKHFISTDINVLHSELNNFTFHNNTPLFAPCIENLKLNDSVITEAPFTLLKTGKYRSIPFVYGYTTREGTMRAEEAVAGNWLDAMQRNFSNFLPVDLKLIMNKTGITGGIRDFYFQGSAISMGTIEDYLDYEGDIQVIVSVIRAARERGLTSKSDVRLLEFAYMGTLNSDWYFNQVPLSGARHGAFVNYLFDYDLKPADEVVSASLISRLTAFAYNRSADPAVRSSAVWQPISNSVLNYLYFAGSSSSTINNTAIFTVEPKFAPHTQRMTFWDNLYKDFYVVPTAPSSSSIAVGCFMFLVLCQMVVRLL